MEKYGYKNISSRNEFEKAAKGDGRVNHGPVVGDELTTYDFVDLKKKGDWGMPGQTRYYVKTIDDLIKANDKMSKSIINKRKPKGYVAW
ncbi:MAG: hypothetical protein EBS19_04960 [Spirochaetia bacterium]|nr:hypothetical protein [Spirochaetia bacterium]